MPLNQVMWRGPLRHFIRTLLTIAGIAMKKGPSPDAISCKATASTLMFALAAHAEEAGRQAAAPTGPPLSVAVIGTGTQGRALLQTLGRQPGANVAAICDHAPPR